MAYTFAGLKKRITDFRHKKVLVVGDLILDEFIWGEVSRISPEAPVPVVLTKHESIMPGGASNVANNLRALGAEVYLAGIIGDDEYGATLRGELDQKGIYTYGVFVDGSRPTTVKTRVVAHHQQVVRIDREKAEPLQEGYVSKIIDFVKGAAREMDGIIIEDYGKGVITPRLLKECVPYARRYDKVISVDPKEEHFRYYRSISVITPNNHEASRAVGFKIKDEKSLRAAGKKLLEMTGCRIVLITLGENGMAVFQKGKAMTHIPTVAQEVFDVSGAGDTVIATFTLALCAGADPVRAAFIANCAAGIVVGKVGIAVVSPHELIERVRVETDTPRATRPLQLQDS